MENGWMSIVAGKLNARFVATVTSAGKYHDGNGLGLMLRVGSSGTKCWVQRIMFRGTRVELGLGSFPVVTLAMAREAAVANKRLVWLGEDPVKQKTQEKLMPTFEMVANEACDLHSHGKNRKYHSQFMGKLKLYAFPKIGSTKIEKVSPSDISEVLRNLIKEKPETGKKLKANLAAVFKYALSKELITEDPMSRAVVFLPKISIVNVHRKSLDHTKVGELLLRIRDTGALPATKLALEFLILTAGRSMEIRESIWSEVDMEKRIWCIPASRMKMVRDHIVPISDRAYDILSEARNFRSPSGLIFPSKRGVALSDNTLSKFLNVTLGYDVNVHGFRSSFRTWAQENKRFSEEACELALSHKVGGKIRNAYARSELLDERRDLLQSWADYLANK